MALLIVGIVLVPAWLFLDGLRYHRVHSDDFAFVAASRTWNRTLANLYQPHNTHIVPSWRLLTWGVVALAGTLEGLQDALGRTAYAALVLTLLAIGRLVARETGRAAIGLTAMVLAGTTWIMYSPTTWFSSGQTLWAGLGILLMLLSLQSWRRHGGAWRLALVFPCAWLAGGFWTIGHLAGPVGTVYLLADGRSRCRKAAVLPLLAGVLNIALSFGLAGDRFDPRTSLHGRTAAQAQDVVQGVAHTLQSIPETLVAGNLGLIAETTPEQGAALSLLLLVAWAWSQRQGRRGTPLEWAGWATIVGAYVIEWAFRGYLPFSSLRGVVPWYDTIPHLGLVLVVSGWWSRFWPSPDASTLVRPSRGQALAILALQGALVMIHQPVVDRLFIRNVPPMTQAEAEVYLIPWLQRQRAVAFDEMIAKWQRRFLVNLDHAEAVATRQGIDREAVREAFGRVDAPGLPEAYDAADMLNLPARNGPPPSPVTVRQALGRFLAMEPHPVMPTPGGAEGLRQNATGGHTPR